MMPGIRHYDPEVNLKLQSHPKRGEDCKSQRIGPAGDRLKDGRAFIELVQHIHDVEKGRILNFPAVEFIIRPQIQAYKVGQALAVLLNYFL